MPVQYYNRRHGVAGNPAAWSHSRIEDFKKCPSLYWHKNVGKTVPFIPSPQMLEGDRVHKMLDARVAKGIALPAGYDHLEPIAAAIANNPEGQLFTETKITLNKQFKPTGFFSDDAWVRVIIDVMRLGTQVAWMGDYKTGNPTFDKSQLKLFAAVGFQVYQSLEQITTSYIWLKPGIPDSETYIRQDLPQMWDELLQEPRRLEQAVITNTWPTKPSTKYCKWCPVNKAMRCPDAAEKYRGD